MSLDDTPTPTLDNIITTYADTITPSKRGGRNEAYMLHAFARRERDLCSQPISDVTSRQIAQWRDRALTAAKPASVHRVQALLQHAIDIAVAEWDVDLPNGNPCKGVRKPSVQNARERRLRAGEWDALMTALRDSRCNPLLKPLIVLAVETACRRGELLSMTWRDVDLQRCVVHLPMTKNGKARTVPLTLRAVEVLASLPKTDDRCIPMSPNAVSLAWPRLTKRCGIRDLHFHDLRHEAISRFVERGLSVFEVQRISGHTDLRMLLRYVNLQVDDLVSKLHAV